SFIGNAGFTFPYSNINYKASDMDNIAFDPTGAGVPLMATGTQPIDPHLGGPGGLNNVTTTKQVLDPSNGVLILASTSETDKYWHNWIELPRPVPVVNITAPAGNTKYKAGAS